MILNQRKQLAQVVWDNKNVTWEKIQKIKKYFPQILKEYNQNMQIIFSNSPSKTENRKITRLTAIPTPVYKEACTEPHDDAISFDQEDDARYCKKGALLFQKKCLHCEKETSDKIDDKNSDLIVPSLIKPIYCCKNRIKNNCDVFLCNDCYNHMNAKSWTKRSSRQKRALV